MALGKLQKVIPENVIFMPTSRASTFYSPMVISHKHKYLFIELPHTASVAIHNELCQNYDGQSILRKHANYGEFLRVASPAEKEYFVFSCVRNPMDMAVSTYYWRKTNHFGLFTSEERRREEGGFITKQMREEFKFINDTDASFAGYFDKFYRLPYDNWSSLDHHKFDFVIRFEDLQADFGKALEKIGIVPVRPLPSRNQTKKRDRDFGAHYTPDVQDKARFIFGPYMKQWGYDFPASWQNRNVPLTGDILFRTLGMARRFYWQYLKESPLYRRVLRLPKRQNRPIEQSPSQQ